MNILTTPQDESGVIASDNSIKETSWLALVSMLCVLFAIACLLLAFKFKLEILGLIATGAFLTAFVSGVVACIVIRRSEHLKGYIYTIVPIFLGGCLTLVMGFVHFTIRMRAYTERAYTCRYNMKLLAEAITKYSQANDGYLPAADRWCDLLMEQDENLSRDNFKHPEIQGSSVAFNKNLDGLRLVDIPDDVVLLFEAKGGWNLIGGEELLNKANPNRNFVDVLLVNREIKTYWVKCGGVKAYDGTFMPLRWKP